ncbi:MAG: hypothetical protein WDM81_01700 [Rhizomicrobium sp.]
MRLDQRDDEDQERQAVIDDLARGRARRLHHFHEQQAQGEKDQEVAEAELPDVAREHRNGDRVGDAQDVLRVVVQKRAAAQGDQIVDDERNYEQRKQAKHGNLPTSISGTAGKCG